LPLTKYYSEKYETDPAAFNNAREISERSIALPVGPHLDVEDMNIVASELKSALAEILK
jgi:dTDP-4-amino-4,6-dideoxygalactose transaminase